MQTKDKKFGKSNSCQICGSNKLQKVLNKTKSNTNREKEQQQPRNPQEHFHDPWTLFSFLETRVTHAHLYITEHRTSRKHKHNMFDTRRTRQGGGWGRQ